MSGRYEYFIKGRSLLDTPFHYTLSGLPNIYLMNGVVFHEDDGYGVSYEIEDIDGLHDTIAAHILVRKSVMTPAEMRFLRKRMKRTQADIAAVLGISDQTVANYEKGETPFQRSTDILIRMLYMLHILPPDAGKAFMYELMRRTEHKDDAMSDIPFMPPNTCWNETYIAA